MARAVESSGKAPFRLLYSNDTTNIVSCISPYHPPRGPFTDDRLRASIDEAASADVHLLQPGMGEIPWWKSKVYPAETHYRSYQQRYGLPLDTFGKYMLAGGDMVQTFTEHCRKRHITPFISIRLNDAHGLEAVGKGNGAAMHTVSRFYEEHYREYRLGPNQESAWHHVLNWAIPEVREHKFALLRELCENYDLGGLELDFLRHPAYFRVAETTRDQRRRIMTEFVARVRQALDRAAPARRRWLCVRVPAMLEAHDALGLDLAELVRAGVDMVNLSGYYYTVQQTDLPKVRQLLPHTALYLEMTHTTLAGKAAGKYDSFPFQRTTPEQFYTTAHLAYQQGADGMSLFNFAYYREHGTAGRGPFNEPPFEVLPHLADRPWLARQSQWYLLAGSMPKPLAPHCPLPKTLKPGASAQFALQLAPTEHQRRGGLLRLMATQKMQRCVWQVECNGIAMPPAAFVRKPIDHPYEAILGAPEQYATFHCPRSAVRPGPNIISVKLLQGEPAELTNLDVVLP